jgi:hypothetical protein
VLHGVRVSVPVSGAARANSILAPRKCLDSSRDVIPFTHLLFDEARPVVDPAVRLQGAREFRDHQAKISAVSRALEAKTAEEIKKTSRINEIVPAEIAKMPEKVKPVVEKFSKDVGPSFVKETYAEIEKVCAKK